MHKLQWKLDPYTSGKQVHGVVAWEVSVVLEVARVGQYGVLILKAGPPCIPTVAKQNDQKTSRAVSECVTGTKIYMTGSWVLGTSVFQCQCAVPGCSALLCALGERKASRPVRWAVFKKQMVSLLKTQSVNTLSPNHA